jgi:hypothetical protein
MRAHRVVGWARTVRGRGSCACAVTPPCFCSSGAEVLRKMVLPAAASFVS